MQAPPNRTLGFIAALGMLVLGCTVPDSPTDWQVTDYPWLTETPDFQTQRLCEESADIDTAPDPIFINCAIEGVDYTTADAEPKDQLHVVAWNLERGHHLDGVIDLGGALIVGDA